MSNKVGVKHQPENKRQTTSISGIAMPIDINALRLDRCGPWMGGDGWIDDGSSAKKNAILSW